jgi:hypothetical protein
VDDARSLVHPNYPETLILHPCRHSRLAVKGEADSVILNGQVNAGWLKRSAEGESGGVSVQ